jgi:hypothetical protein
LAITWHAEAIIKEDLYVRGLGQRLGWLQRVFW